MRQLPTSSPVATGRSAAIYPIAKRAHLLLASRRAIASRMSGWPVGLHAVGKMQHMFDFSSYANLLRSITRVREICYIAAEVISSLDSIQAQRYALNRTEVSAYISSVTSTLQNFEASVDDVDLIAYLVTSFEANPQAWVLQGPVDGTASLHQEVLRLYEFILENPTSLELPLYNPSGDAVITLQTAPQYADLIADAKKSQAKAALDGAATIHAYSAVRIVDHIYSLMLDKTLWNVFITQRTVSTTATNLERGKGLRVFATYLQQLLIYPYFAGIEAFLWSYETIQEWLVRFPPLDTETKNHIESTIREHDLLGAKDDIRQLLNSFSKPQGSDAKASLIIPEESLVNMGILTKLKAAIMTVESNLPAPSLSDLRDFDNPKYLPIISGMALSAHDAVYTITNLVIEKKRVAEEVRNAVATLIPAFARTASKETFSALNQLAIKVKLPFALPTALSYEVERGADSHLGGDAMYIDDAAPLFSRDYHTYLRKEQSFKLVTDSAIKAGYPAFNYSYIVDHHRAKEVRDMIGIDTRTLVPTSLAAGDRVFTPENVQTDKHAVVDFFSSLTGRSYDMIIRELTVPHLARLWATAWSSFCLIFVDAALCESDTGVKLKYEPLTIPEADAKPSLITGYGRPYGVSYTDLNTLNDGKMIHVGSGIFIKFLAKVPVPTTSLTVEDNFYLQQPFMYFSGNGTTQDISTWVLGEYGFNFSLFPVSLGYTVPPVVLTPKHMYVNQRLYLNLDPFFKPSVAAKPRLQIDLPLVEHEWPFERYQYHLKYIHFGAYSSGNLGAVTVDPDDLTASALAKIEKHVKEDAQETTDNATKAANANDKTAQTVQDEAAEVTGTAKKANDSQAGDDTATDKI